MTMSTPPKVDGRSDSEARLSQAVREHLRQYNPLRTWADSVQIDAQGSTITLSGAVRSQTTCENAERLARQVPGVEDVVNSLQVDAEIELAIAQALAADPHTAPEFPSILVGVVFGVVYLKGQVSSIEAKKAAAQIAAAIPGVRSVSDELTTVPELKAAQKQPTLKPPETVKPAA